jgi:hypothetical protein
MIPYADRSILHAAALLGVLGLGFWASPAAAQLAPWQQPPRVDRTDPSSPHPLPGGEGTTDNPLLEENGTTVYHPPEAWAGADRSAPGLDSPEYSSTPWAGEDYEREGNVLGYRPGYLANLAYESLHDRVWARSEFLAWWPRGFATPPLLTTSPTGTDPSQAGVLGAPGTSVLLGGDDLGGGFRPGERITFGAWLCSRQTLGIEASYLQINRQTEFLNTSGVTTPILARPFFNTQAGQQDAQPVNSPDLQSGTFSSAVATELQVAEVLFRKNLNRQPGFAVDLLAGYRYQQLEDHLAVYDTLTFSGTQSGYPAGSVVQQSDIFNTRNVFQGGEVGMSTSLHYQRWSIDSLLKIGVGQTHTRVTIAGATTTTIPGQSATVLPGGFLALPSNMGTFDSNQFSVVPDLGLTLGFDLAPQLRATIGYEAVYWNNVARPGDQIDPNIDPLQFPPPATTTSTRPAFMLHTSDYWTQGLNLGLDLRF